MNNQEQSDAANDAGGTGARDQTAPAGGPVGPHLSPSPHTTKLFSPVRFLIITIGGLFMAEIAAMVVITLFQDLPYAVQSVIDATVMVILIFPLVYFFSLKPLIRHIEERKRAEYALRRSEERFIKAFHSSPAALTITRVQDGTFIDVNQSFLRLTHYAREEVIGNSAVGLAMFVDAELRTKLAQEAMARHMLDREGVRDVEVKARIKSGEIRTVLLSTEAIELEGDRCFLTSISDITERKQSEERLRRLNRALSVLKEGNQLLTRATDENELLNEMCEIIVNVGEYRMAWVGFANHDEGKTIRPIAYAGYEDGYLEQASISWGENDHGHGPTGTAIREGLIQVNHNFFNDPNVVPWRESALARGYHSSIALPLKDGDATYGALTIYAPSSNAFDPEEVNLLTELANDLMFGIRSLQVRAERNRAQEQAREMALFPSLNPDAVLQVDDSGLIRMTNPAAATLGIFAGGQLTDIIPDLAGLDLPHCIASGTTQHVADTRLGDLVLMWTVKGAPALGLAFLYSTDMTDHKLAERRIYQLSRIVEQTEDTVVVTNCDGVIEYVNPAFERLTGYARDEVLGANPSVVKSGLHDMQFFQNLWTTILNGEVFQAEIANRKKDGQIFYEAKTITPLRDEHGAITHFVATGKDITQRKRDEEQLRKAYDELEARVQERTMELRIAISELADEIQIRVLTEEALRHSEDRLNRAQEIAHLGSWELDLNKNELSWSDEVYRIFGLQPQQFGATYEAFLQVVHPEDRAAVDAAYTGSIRDGRDQYEIEHRIIKHLTGEIRVVHEKCEHFRSESGQIIRSVGMVHDITERKQAEEALRAARDELELRVQERTRELAERNIQLQGLSIAEREQRQLSEALFEAALVLNKSMKLEEVLPLILRQIKEVIPYQLANISLLDGDFFYDAGHAGDERWSEALGGMTNRFPLDQYPLMVSMRECGQPVLIQDTRQEAHWITVPGLEWCRSYLSAPLLVEDKVIGFVTLFEEQPGFFTQAMCDRLMAFAAHAAVAIQNAWLFEQVRASNERLQSLSRRLVEIQESERLYIARELHDEAGQMLTSLILDLRMLEINAGKADVTLKKVAEMEVSLNDVLESLHRVAMSLRPASLDHLGLVAALRQHAETVGEKHGLQVSFRSGKFRKRLPSDMETELYRIVQEALTNVVRHANAHHVDIVLTRRDDDLVVIVEDDGIGFDPEAALSKDRMGLFSMRERAEMIGGKLVIESAPGKGTTLMVEVKYADTNSDNG